jgi:hypothetical protein
MTTELTRPPLIVAEVERWVRANAPPPDLSARLKTEWETEAHSIMQVDTVFADVRAALDRGDTVVRNLLYWSSATQQLRESTFTSDIQYPAI